MSIFHRIRASLSRREHPRQREHTVARGPVVHDADDSRLVEEWMERTTGKPSDQVTTRDLLAVPRRHDLRYEQLVSPLGGRMDQHLLHLNDDEADRLLAEGDEFIAATPTDDSPVEH